MPEAAKSKPLGTGGRHQEFPGRGTRRSVVKVLSRNRILQGILLASAVLLATSAFASNKASFELQHPTQVGDKQLAPGTYTVQWQGSGDQIQMNILRRNKEVASIPGHVVTMEAASPYDSALVNVNQDGSRSLSQIRFRGKKFALVVNDAGGSGAASAGSGR